ncbi:MAG: right-handed parallel beta-helix repeat-containing protein [Planctomycetes bacterium]|nr:right-handed parallel beta-helix repeat-containing protein [Planctomycetota bacterium]MBI3835723.1 right-handed parallel beta-helix repeat-containing protein [Planctomycetota bacterium]
MISIASAHRSITVLIVFTFFASKTCIGATNYHVPADYPTIQACIIAAQTGDECVVAPGRYSERINFRGRAIILHSLGGAAVTTIDGTGLGGSVVTFDHGETSSTILDGFTITGGTGPNGGGMYIYNGSPMVTNCAFIRNSVAGSGGGIFNYNSNPTLINCTFYGNSSLQNGGGIYNSSSNPQIANCTFSANVAQYLGGAIYGSSSNSSPKANNCILWGNHPDQVNGSATISNSDIEGGWTGLGNINVDPVFLNAYGGDLRLRSGSPCIDAGDNAAIPVGITTDMDRNVRRVDDLCASDTGHGPAPIVDMGAFELPAPPRCGDGVCDPGDSCELCACDCGACCGDGVCSVHENCISCPVDCTCPTLHVPGDYGLIQEAIAAAHGGDEIIVGPGMYNEAIDFLGKAITVRSSNGPSTTKIDATGLNRSVVTCRLGEGPATLLDGFTIKGGKANSGGGMYNDISSPTIRNCTFSQNVATNEGGGIYNNRGKPVITNCRFIHNSSWIGGALENWYSNSTIVNCIFVRNDASSDGGGIDNYNSNPTVTNCTFFGNTTTGFGGGMSNAGGNSVPTVTNCILWDNFPDQITNRPIVSSCDVKGGWSGVGNINADPLFANANKGDVRLRSGSPCIDAGNNGGVPVGLTMDLDGSPRFTDDRCAINAGYGVGPLVDMGAFEAVTAPECGNGICEQGESCESCVCDCGECCGDGICAPFEDCLTCAVDCLCKTIHVPDEYELIQDAIQDAKDGDEISVAPGRYSEVIDFLGKTIVVRSSAGPDVTTIDATGLNSSVVTCWNEEGPNTVLDGFTITGGRVGMTSNASNPTVANCVFTGNQGAGMTNSLSSPIVRNCSFIGNSSAGDGGGMSNDFYSSPTVTRCTFRDNTVQYRGGGMANNFFSSPQMTNCSFIGNKAQWGGGAIHNTYNSNPTITNSTFDKNLSGPYKDGGALFNDQSNPTLANCILWNNYPNQITQINGGATAISFSNIKGGWIGDGNIDAEPMFLDEFRDDLHLMSGSPCVDAGSNAALPLGATNDLGGSARRVDDPCTLDTGLGTAPVVDMGGFELASPSECGNGVCDGGETCELCACDCGNCCGDGICSVHEDCLSCVADCSCLILNVPADYDGIQNAIEAARNGDEVIINQGTYFEAIDLLGKAITVRSSYGPRVTTIDATGLDTSVVTCQSGEGPATRIDGLTITGGKAHYGGGMHTEYHSGPTVSNCKFTKNAASEGGGMYNSGSTPTVINCEFNGNTASSIGGGMLNDSYSSATVVNCAFFENTAGGGGGIYNYDSNLALTSCTFSGNVATGGAMFNFRSTANVTGSILWDNYPNQITNNTSNNVTVRFSNVEGNWPGTGNLAGDPLFVPGPIGCFYLSQKAAGQAVDSPCLNSGSDTAAILGLNAMTTRSDEGTDSGRVDLGYHYPVTRLPLVMGDFDRNERAELSDFLEWRSCMHGPAYATVSPCCRIFDMELDGHVDLADFAKFQSALRDFPHHIPPSCDPKDPRCESTK